MADCDVPQESLAKGTILQKRAPCPQAPAGDTQCDNYPMDERELTCWLDALVEQGLIEEWRWTLHVDPGQPAAVSYLIDVRPYTQDGAVKLVRDFEAASVSSIG